MLRKRARQKQTSHENIQHNAEILRTTNRMQSQSRRDMSGYQGPTISDMRQDHSTNEKVDEMMGPVRSIPAFSNIGDEDHDYPQPRLKKKPTQFQGGERKGTPWTGGTPSSTAHED